MFNDLRYALRMLRKSPGFTIVAVLSLALGIGSNSTIFSALNALVYRPLPYPEPDWLVVIWETNLKGQGSMREPALADVLDWKIQNHVFEDIASVSGIGEVGTETLTDAGGAERVSTQGASANLFSLLGVKPVLGRVFVPEEASGRAETVVISDSFWRRKFDGSPNVLGSAFNIEGTDCTVVGVMPPGLSFVLSEQTDV